MLGWTYTPSSHKSEHHEWPRAIPLGPKAQEIIRPWLRLNVSEYLFQPREAEAERHAAQRAARETPLYPFPVKHQAGKQVERPQRAPRDRYDSVSLRRAISWARLKANRARKAEKLPEIPDWFPYQLRHSLATKVERMFGLEASKACLGHASAQVTSKFYVERQDQAREAEVMGKIG
jgi:integrase